MIRADETTNSRERGKAKVETVDRTSVVTHKKGHHRNTTNRGRALSVDQTTVNEDSHSRASNPNSDGKPRSHQGKGHRDRVLHSNRRAVAGLT